MKIVFLSWLPAIAKLLGLCFLFLLFVVFSKKVEKDLEYPIPYFLLAFLPFFLLYEILFAAKQETLVPSGYTLVFSTGLILALLLVLRKNNAVSRIRIELINLLGNHKLFFAFLSILFVVLIFRGIYLEYPGDPIIYFQRIGQANQNGVAFSGSVWRYSSIYTFFGSFQQWIVGTDFLLREKLNLIAAINACVLCLANYRLALWCTQSKKLSVLATLLFLAFYGNLQISFLLYKNLQGATLAMIIYLEIIPILYSVLTTQNFARFFTYKKSIDLLLLGLGVWICLDCHKEKVFYLFAVSVSFALVALIKGISSKRRIPFLVPFVALFFLGFQLWSFLSDRAPSNPFPPLATLWTTVGNYDVFSYWPTPFNSSYLLLDLVSFGLILVVLQIADLRSRSFFIGAVALSPSLMFLNSIAVTGLIKLTATENIYRLMIAGLPWIFLPMACLVLSREKGIRIGYLPWLFLLLGFLAYPPIYGKVPHFFVSVPEYADGRDLSPIIKQLLKENQDAPTGSLSVLSTPYVNSYLAAWPVFTVQTGRWIYNNTDLYGRDLPYLFSSEITAEEIAANLVARDIDIVILDKRQGISYASWMGWMTGHWPPDLIQNQIALFAGESLYRYLEQNTEHSFVKVIDQNGFLAYRKVEGDLAG